MYIDCLLSYLVTVPSAVLCFFPMKDQLKYSRRKTLLIAGTVGFVTLAVSSFLIWRYQLYANDLLVPILSIFFVSYQFCLNAKPWKSLAVFSAAVALMSIIGNMAACFDSYLQFTAGTESGSRASMIFQLIVSTVVTLLLAKPYRERGSMIVNRTEQPRVWYTTLLFSAAVFAVNMLLLPIEREKAYEEIRILYLELILIALLFLWLLMQIIFYFIVSGLLSMADTEKRNRFLEMQQMQFASQQRYMKDSEKVRHDFRHSIRTLAELYDSGNMDAVGKYLHEYIEAMPVSEITPYCENTAVNAILNYYAHVAQQNGIDFTLKIRLPAGLAVSDMDLCNMIGNILENAVIACQKAEERTIQLSVIAEENAQLFIVVVNAFDGKVRMKDGRYLSTDRDGNGIGLSSVISTAESYGGVAQFSHEGKRFFSNVAIPLQS